MYSVHTTNVNVYLYPIIIDVLLIRQLNNIHCTLYNDYIVYRMYTVHV